MVGKRLGGRYELLDRVGGGGMAVVYKAKDLLLDRVVAVKVLRAQYAIDDDFVHRFRREAQAAASLSHPNIVSIYDVGVEEEVHYIVMEYVEGSTLKEYITNYAPLRVEEAVHITKQIAEALEHAHYNQIIHRDIKPHNILIGKHGRIKVTDFGIARAVTSSTITHTGSVIGSVHYFSPEQARGGATGEKSDIYSLGIVLYEMLTGSLPFSGDSPISVALKHLQESYTEPRNINPRIPQSVENIIFRALAKDPIQRYSSAKAMISDLDTCLEPNRLSEEKYFNHLDGDDEEATKVIPVIKQGMMAPPDEDEEEEEEEERKTPPSKKKRWLKIGIISLIIFLFGFGMYQGYQALMDFFYVKDFKLIDVTNLDVEEAKQKLEKQGLRVDITQRPSEEFAEGLVMKQEPRAGANVRENTFIRLTVSSGKDKVQMPTLTTLLEETATKLLVNSGFKQENIEIIYENNPDVQAGYVVSQEPNANEPIIPDETKIKLVISKGKEKFEMPNLIGKTKDEAEAILLRYNLVLEKVEEDFSDFPVGQVYQQHPIDPGQEVVAGTPIRIWVSKGYKEKFKDKKEEVVVFVDSQVESKANVSIFLTDVNGDRQIVGETIEQTKSYKITVKVSREQNATIKVFKNGQLYENRVIKFEQ